MLSVFSRIPQDKSMLSSPGCCSFIFYVADPSAPLKLARHHARSLLPLAALRSMSLLPFAPLAWREHSARCCSSRLHESTHGAFDLFWRRRQITNTDSDHRSSMPG